ncbi:hypothetical protein XaraCFBP7407_12745 [Xanthomonas arboricola pv. arracaciae]|uniref:hypothetical protein n=1 Tax=Xanthomonas arboricola TaxID=56448 RepID=UPI000CEE9B7C|nr:hypothetical protein [Xanthomonas arboricola]PPT95028.1 hypothetical protein XaraCFBP7407_12745 [Xanthomonas arboricola pv. arracaciae]
MTVWNFLTLLLVGGALFIVVGSLVTLKLHSERAAFKENYQRFHFNKRTAIAISTARSSIKFKTGSDPKAYQLSDVRSWDKHWHRSKHEGTITVNVRDIDHPNWTISFGNEREMDKWYELIRQAVNEGLKL